MSSSQLAIVQTYKVQTNGNSTASKAKKPSHGSHSISVYCNNTSANYCNIFAYLWNVFCFKIQWLQFNAKDGDYRECNGSKVSILVH